MGASFSTPVQADPGAHPASFTMGTESFPGVERPGCGVNHSPPSSAEVKKRVELHQYSASRPSKPVLGLKFTLRNHGTNWSESAPDILSPLGEPQGRGDAFETRKKV
jgi:hypothetical protein